MATKPSTPAPHVPDVTTTYPAPYILLITINRARAMNSLPFATQHALHKLFTWFDGEPSLRAAVITGAGDKAFCAGQDLVELERLERVRREGGGEGVEQVRKHHPEGGFGGLSRRRGRKPVVAAVNGFALGGGFEMVLNCDISIASPTATFALPEVQRGIYAAAGGLPRLVRTIGMPLASELALTGRRLSAQEALELRLVNAVSARAGAEVVVAEAVAMAGRVAAVSPDAVVVTRAGLREAWERGSVEGAVRAVEERFKERLFEGENVKEGLAAFREKRAPRWVPSKL